MANYMARKRRPSEVLPKGTKILGDPRQPQGVVAGINYRIEQLEAKLTEARSDITYACGVINTLSLKYAALNKRVGDKPEPQFKHLDATLPNRPVGDAEAFLAERFDAQLATALEAARKQVAALRGLQHLMNEYNK